MSFSKLYKPNFSSANWTGNDVKHDILGPGGSWFKSSYNIYNEFASKKTTTKTTKVVLKESHENYRNLYSSCLSCSTLKLPYIWTSNLSVLYWSYPIFGLVTYLFHTEATLYLDKWLICSILKLNYIWSSNLSVLYWSYPIFGLVTYLFYTEATLYLD